MEKFRIKLKRKCIFCGIVLVIIALNFYGVITAKSKVSDFIFGIQIGSLLGAFTVLCINLVKYIVLYKNNDKLRKYYIKIHDERNIFVMYKCVTKAMTVILFLLCIFTVVFGFIDKKICFTLFFVFLISEIIMLAFKIYYEKKL